MKKTLQYVLAVCLFFVLTAVQLPGNVFARLQKTPPLGGVLPKAIARYKFQVFAARAAAQYPIARDAEQAREGRIFESYGH